jgi:formylglycine-generating enzyme required for sulfatase activity
MKNLLTFFLCFTIAQAYTQSIVNVSFRQEGETVRITYDLKEAQNGQTFNIELYCSTDGGRTYGNALKAVSGDVGEKIIGGYSKTIIWQPMQENITTLESDKVKFKVTATIKSTMPDNMVFVKGGVFQMGGDDGGSDEKPIHSVTVNDFYIGKYEVTQKEWRAIMGTNPSHFKDCDNCPVERVSWNDVQEYIKKLNAKTGKNYRLPTEAEWEYAARGGNQSKGYTYSGSNTTDNVAWNDENSYDLGSEHKNYGTNSVGQKSPNELGIYDMSGNVWEWCSDWYGSDYYKNSSSNNPKGANSGTYRVLRGGAWYNSPASCRIAFRFNCTPTFRFNRIGFRVVFP